ncbi:unnamed protein product [Mycena citricolor]|uniref:Pkinase-domain-containing protein n=1 Tax=Mycena citricolor TaxID=2018698 RepID=A0AAD2H0H3_9AGAR|nr:unnamed protein product [Mycena citricolor]
MDNPHAFEAARAQDQYDENGEPPQTQPESQEYHHHIPLPTADAVHWGEIEPVTSHEALPRVSFPKAQKVITIGRGGHNSVPLLSLKISWNHANILWNGADGEGAEFTVYDLSTNGTYIGTEKIGKGQSRSLRNGEQISFSTAPTGGGERDPRTDFRFMFREYVSGVDSMRPVLNTYKQLKVLGSGAFAIVYKAERKGSPFQCAIKHIRKAQGYSAVDAHDSRKTLHDREINIMRNLKHPNICSLIECFWNADSSVDLVMELIEGGDLLEAVINNGGLPEWLVQRIAYQVTDALQYMHSLGVTHRDLKPENILLTRDLVAKVADFGLAKIVDEATMLRTMCGTPAYLAPEVVMQIKGSGYDNKVDSWSLGVIIFSSVTNAVPFIEDESLDLKRRIMERTLDWGLLDQPFYDDQPLSEDAKSFVRALLVVNPAQRMGAADGLRHPWLQSYEALSLPPTIGKPTSSPEIGSRIPADAQSYISLVESKSSFLDVKHGFGHMQLNASSSSVAPVDRPDSDDREDTPAPVSAVEDSRLKSGLIRGSQAVREAAAAGVFFEPPSAMVSYFQSLSLGAKEASTPAANGKGKGKGKRMHDEAAAPMIEDVLDSSLSSLDSSPPEPLRKKTRNNAGKVADDASPTKAPARPKRASAAAGKPASNRKGRKAKDEPVPAPVPTRRSTRKRS